jgi:hypothetical protein
MPTTYAEPKSDAYTGLLAISLGAMVLGSIILFLDFNQYDKKPAMPPAPKLRAPVAAEGGQPAVVPPPPPGEAAPPKEKEEKEKEKEK